MNSNKDNGELLFKIGDKVKLTEEYFKIIDVEYANYKRNRIYTITSTVGEVVELNNNKLRINTYWLELLSK